MSIHVFVHNFILMLNIMVSDVFLYSKSQKQAKAEAAADDKPCGFYIQVWLCHMAGACGHKQILEKHEIIAKLASEKMIDIWRHVSGQLSKH